MNPRTVRFQTRIFDEATLKQKMVAAWTSSWQPASRQVWLDTTHSASRASTGLKTAGEIKGTELILGI